MKKGERTGGCTVCRHAERYRIEIILCGGASARAVATKFALSDDAVLRHWKRHVSAERKAQLVAGPLKFAELAERAAAEGISLIDYLSLVRSTLLAQFAAAAEAGDRHGTATLAGRLLECLREIGRLTGEISRGVGVNIQNNMLVMNSPLIADLQAMLLKALEPYPEARAAVFAGIDDLERRAMAGALPAPIEVEATVAA